MKEKKYQTMDDLLPSEIARLVLGYLEEQNCKEAAQLFLEMSPNLQECRTFASRGRKFSTRVNGLTLSNILDKFSAANTLGQEKLAKVDDESRGQRFVVNISVPTPNSSQTAGGSPIISSSMRKRRHSGPSDKGKKNPKTSNSLPNEKQSEVVNHVRCETVETTSLDQLPGHTKSLSTNLKAPESSSKDDSPAKYSSTVNESPVVRTEEKSEEIQTSNSTISEICDMSIEQEKSDENLGTKCSTGTDTQELMRFTTTEVQTAPYEALECDMTDRTVENLSILTKELLNRTDLQEKIAENINRANLPGDLSLREPNQVENTGNCNTSIMTEINNAIQSIVASTESEPTFLKFIDDMFGTEVEAETSPDEDGHFADITPEKNPEPSPTMSIDPQDTEIQQNIQITEQKNIIEIPNPLNSELNKNHLDTHALDDVNAAAILSIINVNTLQDTNEDHKIPDQQIPLNNNIINELLVSSEIPLINNNVNEPLVPSEILQNDPSVTASVSKPAKKIKKMRAPRPKPQIEVTPNKPIPEMEIMEGPTLIVCSKEEMSEIISAKSPKPISMSQFVPIAPKDTYPAGPVVEPMLYLRAVNLKVPVSCNLGKIESRRINPQQVQKPTVIPTNVVEIPSNVEVPEAITLYGDQNVTETVISAAIPTVNLDDEERISGTGLSPFLKLNRHRNTVGKPVVESENLSVNESNPISTTNCEMIAKRTPRSLLKSRSKNHRLSLSTPRRRSNHIRALDFNTPTKGLNTSRRMSDADKSQRFTPKSSNLSKSGFRTSLFKSPPFGLTPSGKKLKSPVNNNNRSYNKVPIATRGLEPKLTGGWDKYTGVGLILGNTSSQSNSCPSSPEKQPTQPTPKPAPIVKKSWDADLRQSLASTVEPVVPKVVSKKTKKTANQKKIPEKKEIVNNCNNEKTKKKTNTTNKNNKKNNDIKKKTENENNKKSHSLVKENCVNDVKLDENNPSPCIEPSIKNTDDKGILKKYAKLKTLTTTVTVRNEQEKRGDLLSVAVDLHDKSIESTSINPSLCLPNITELETPRKFDNVFGVPATPRVLSPGSSNTTPFARINEDSVKVQGFVSTPEFPSTPGISITPKQISDNTIEAIKDKEFGGSSYFQPSTELITSLNPSKIKTQTENSKTIELSSILQSSLLATEIAIASISNVDMAPTKSIANNLEITQFEVIKENLSREDAVRELKLSSTPKDLNGSDIRFDKETTINKTEISNIISRHDSKNHSKSLDSSGTADDSSDSDSDSSSSGSSSSCSCCSSCMNDTNTSSRISTGKKTKKTPNKCEASCSSHKFNDLSAELGLDTPEIDKRVIIAPPVLILEDFKKDEKPNTITRENNEASPTKVFSIAKTEEMLLDADIETPAKDEALLAEADIGETPSSSKAGIETLTNLSSKISAFIAKDRSKTVISEENKKKSAKPKIMSIETLSSSVTIAIRSDQISDFKNTKQAQSTTTNTNLQTGIVMDAKLCRELEEKRLRTLNKLKEPPLAPLRGRRNTAPKKMNTKRTQNLQQKPENLEQKNIILEEHLEAINKRSKSRVSRVPHKLVKIVEEPKISVVTNSQPKKNSVQEKEKTTPAIVGVRKSLRNVERKAKRGLSAPPESHSILKKYITERKAQSTRDPNANDDILIDNNINGIRQEASVPSEIDKILHGVAAHDIHNFHIENKNEKNTEVIENIENIQAEINGNDLVIQHEEIIMSEPAEEIIISEPAEEKKQENTRSKVDMIKRDLFNEAENINPRTLTGSKSQQMSDTNKIDCIESNISPNDEKLDVLECLELVPTNKSSDQATSGLESGAYQHVEISYVYDETKPTKRRRRKFSNSELEYKIQIEGDDGEDMCKTIKATNFQEIFSLSPPKRKRQGAAKPRIVKEKVVPTVVRKRRAPIKLRNSKEFVAELESLPLATSSPTQDNMVLKNIERVKPIDEKNSKSETEKGGKTTRKRKISGSKDDQSEKKTRPNPDPKVLLSQMDLNQFLTNLHGPE